MSVFSAENQLIEKGDLVRSVEESGSLVLGAVFVVHEIQNGFVYIKTRHEEEPGGWLPRRFVKINDCFSGTDHLFVYGGKYNES